METVDELYWMAHELYARGRKSVDPATKQMLLQRADDLLKQAYELRKGSVTINEFPKLGDIVA